MNGWETVIAGVIGAGITGAASVAVAWRNSQPSLSDAERSMREELRAVNADLRQRNDELAERVAALEEQNHRLVAELARLGVDLPPTKGTTP